MAVSATIRAARPADAATIEAVAAAAWEHDYPEVLGREHPGKAAREWYDPERLARDIEDPTNLFRAAEHAGTVVGFVHGVGPSGETDGPAVGNVLRVYVHPDARGEGVGRALLDAARSVLAERGCTEIRATVLAANEAGCAFYEACGFERTGETAETTIDGGRYEEVVFAESRRS